MYIRISYIADVYGNTRLNTPISFMYDIQL